MDHPNDPAAQRPAADSGPPPGPVTPADIGPRVARQAACDDHKVPPHTGDDDAECPGGGLNWSHGQCKRCSATRADLADVREGTALARRCPVHPGGKTLLHRGASPDWPHVWQCPARRTCWWASLTLTAVLVTDNHNPAPPGDGYLTAAQWDDPQVARAHLAAAGLL